MDILFTFIFDFLLKPPLPSTGLFFPLSKIYVNSVQKGNKVPNYILLIYLDVIFVINIECNRKEMKNSKCYSISILRPSNIHSTVWL